MRNNTKEPLIRIVKREGLKKRYIALLYAASVVIALGVGAILLFSLEANPGEYYKQMFTLGTINNRFAYLQYENYIKEFEEKMRNIENNTGKKVGVDTDSGDPVITVEPENKE